MERLTIAEYLRISDEDKDMKQSGKDESGSIANQRSLLSDFIGSMPEFENAEIIEFCDDGWSGKNFERPAVREMLDQVKRGTIQCIVVKDLSRFGRDYLAVGNYISRVFPFMGVRFIAVNDGFDSIRGADIDSLETSFKTLLYDLYSRDLSRKVRNAKKFKAERGEFLSPFAPYGYVKSPGNKNLLVIDAEAAQTVRRIFRMAAEGTGTMQIARTLNGEKVKTPSLYKKTAGCTRREWKTINEENFWTQETVGKILRDERYMGRAVFGKHMRDEAGSTHVVGVKRSEWITADNAHDGIVTKEEFDRAQEQLRKLRECCAGQPGMRGNALYRKVRCGCCGHSMKRENTKNPYYVCKTPRVTDRFSCGVSRIPESGLLEAVLSSLRAQAQYAVEAGRIWEEKHRHDEMDRMETARKIAGLKESRSALETYIRELYEKFALGGMDKAEYMAAKSSASKKRDETAAQIRELEAVLDNMENDGNRFTDCFSRYVQVSELTPDIVSDVLKEIRVYPDDTVCIMWNYGEDLERLLEDTGNNNE